MLFIPVKLFLALFSFLHSRSLKTHFLKHPSLLHRRGTFSPMKGIQKWFLLDGFWLKGFLSFSVFRRWRQFWFLWHWKQGRQPFGVGKWNNEDNNSKAKKHVWGETIVGVRISPHLRLRHPVWVITCPWCWAKQVDSIHPVLCVPLMRRARL